jgi:hypothetical protein
MSSANSRVITARPSCFWNEYEPNPATIASQKQVAAALRSLADAAASPTEKERLDLTKQVEFLVHYAAAWLGAHRLHGLLGQATELRSSGKADQARNLVATQGVAMLIQFAPEIRRAMLDFQSVVSTRNDLGTLASIASLKARCLEPTTSRNLPLPDQPLVRREFDGVAFQGRSIPAFPQLGHGFSIFTGVGESVLEHLRSEPAESRRASAPSPRKRTECSYRTNATAM